MGELAAQSDENVHSMEDFLGDALHKVEFLDDMVHAVLDQLRARLRVLERSEDSAFLAQVRAAEDFVRAGEHTELDPPELLEKRLHDLTST
jgi:hypothetical protein